MYEMSKWYSITSSRIKTLNECKKCIAGRYSSETSGASSCTQCLKGTYSTEVGASAVTVCKTCLAGQYSSATSGVSCHLPFNLGVFFGIFGLICGLIGGGIVFYRRRKKEFQEDNELTHQLLSETMDERAALAEDRDKLQLAWVVKYQDISLEAAIGAGAFGEVWRGSWRGIDVAIKKVFPSMQELMEMQMEESDSESDSDDDNNYSSSSV